MITLLQNNKTFFLINVLTAHLEARFSLQVNWKELIQPLSASWNKFFHSSRIHQASNWTQLNAPKTGSAYLLIWYQFISALWAIKQANPRWSDKILLRLILQYRTCPDYYTKNIEHVIRHGWCWNGEVHSPITPSWPSVYPGHTESYAWLSELGRTHSDTQAGP